MSYRGLHGFSRLQHFGHDQFVVVEQPPHLGHAGHERSVDDFERSRAFRALQFQIGDEAIAGAFDDVVGEPLIERQVRGAYLNSRPCLAEMLGNGRDMELVDGGALPGEPARASLPAQDATLPVHRRAGY